MNNKNLFRFIYLTITAIVFCVIWLKADAETIIDPSWPILPENNYNEQNYIPKWSVKYNHSELRPISVDLPLSEVIKDGKLHIPDEDRTMTDLGESWRYIGQYWTTAQLTIPPSINGNNARLEARIKAPLSEGAMEARDPFLEFSGVNGKTAFVYWMADPWGAPFAEYAAGDTIIRGIPEFVKDFNDWHTVVIETKDGKVTTFYDGQEIRNMDYTNTIGPLYSIRIGFKGRGSIDWVKLYEGDTLKLSEDFDIDGETNVHFTQSQPQTPDPVIIIPGIMGSWEKNGKWEIDPISHVYDNLIDEFFTNGYENGEDNVPGGNFFTFPYEWRDSNKINAVKLAGKIRDIKNQTGRIKVDIVAHSMGGLLAREYIESNYYQNDVDQLITIGTPHLGAPKDYIKWEAGESFFDVFDVLTKKLMTLEAIENGYLSIFDYIHKRPITSVQELLPIYNYLYNVENNNALRASYPNNYPRNEFLESLNSTNRTDLLNDIEFTKIIGKTNSESSTVSGYNVMNENMSKFWIDGYPKYFDIPLLNRQGIIKSSGDGTVPLFSAEALNIPSDRTIFFQSEHNDLPTDAQKGILEILTGKKPTSEIRKWHVTNILLLLVHSPVDIQVKSPNGKRIGKDFDTNKEFDEIEGAYYTGFDTNSEFIAIPNPEEGKYEIVTQGTEEGGSYEVEVARVGKDEDNSDIAKEVTGTIRGIIQSGEIIKTTAQLDENNVIAVDIPTIRRNIEHYTILGYIKDKEETNYYFARLKLLEKLIVRLDDGKKDKKPLDNIKNEISTHIDHLIDHIRKNSSDSIDRQAAKFLIDDLKDLKNIIITN